MNRRNKDIFRRGRKIKNGRTGKGPVVYYMFREMRSSNNWPLLFSLQEAAAAERALLVFTCFNPQSDELTHRTVHFYKEGLLQVERDLGNQNVRFEIHRGKPLEILARLLYLYQAHSLILDFDPLRATTRLKTSLFDHCTVPIYEVDGHNIIPAWIASQKKEYGAYTLRPKINRLLPEYLSQYPEMVLPSSLWEPNQTLDSRIDLSQIRPVFFNNDAVAVNWPPPGQLGAAKTTELFFKSRLQHYHRQRNDPLNRMQSELSPYFHFGHISSQQVALMTHKAAVPREAKDAFLEELIIRKELSDNYCLYETNYDNFEGIHQWAQQTLNVHRTDKRQYIYSFEQFEGGKTHEQLWNSCQNELKTTGKLHGYLRMYWAKKILEWSQEPEEAQKTAITLNDRYALDGRDPNGYTGVAWSIGGVHDRAWQERDVFGKIRYMNENGCKRKFDVRGYINSHFAIQPGPARAKRMKR